MQSLTGAWQPQRDYKVVELSDDSALLFITGNHRLLRTSGATGRRLSRGLDTLTDDERAEWEALSAAGVLSMVNRERLEQSAFHDGANLAINVNLTAVCNLSCSYCFAEGGDYGRIKGKMELHTVDYIFDFIRRHVTPSQKVRFEFFGGEPLLNFPIIDEICRRADALRAAGLRFCHRISTNLTELPDGALELFAREKFTVSVSIDGLAATHDRNRPTKGGRGSFVKILENCRRVRAASDEITLVARMTVMAGPVSLLDNVLGLRAYNLFDYFQIYPGVVAPEKAALLPLSSLKREPGPAPMIAPDYLQQLGHLFDHYASLFSSDNRFRGALEYERIVDFVVNGRMALAFCSGGRDYYTFSPDDSVMPCHRLVGEVQFAAGTGAAGLTAPLDPWRTRVDEHPVCSQCWVRYMCGGGCKQENFLASGDLNQPHADLCAYQTRLVENVVRMVAQQPDHYRALDRAPLDDLFVSCGRPVVANQRHADRDSSTRKYFHAL